MKVGIRSVTSGLRPGTGGLAVLLAAGVLLFLALPGGSAAAAISCPFNSCDATLVAGNDDGSDILFTIELPLSHRDRNQGLDLYRARNGLTTLVSSAPAGSPRGGSPVWPEFAGVRNGEPHAIFTTEDAFLPEDRDQKRDIYEAIGGKLRLLTPAPRFPEQSGEYDFGYGIYTTSPDGSVLFVGARSRLTAADRDDDYDLYRISEDDVTLLSDGPLAGGSDSDDAIPEAHAPDPSAPDGIAIYFATSEPLLPADTDDGKDIYRVTTGGIELATPWEKTGEFGLGASKTVPGRVYLSIRDGHIGAAPPRPHSLYLADRDEEPVLITSSDTGIYWQDESPDGATVYFLLRDRLVPEDRDRDLDIYAWQGGEVSMVSAGPRGSPSDRRDDDWGDNEVVKVTPDGDVIFVSTSKLVREDHFSDPDLYVRSGSEVRLLSRDWRGRTANGDISAVQVLDDGRFVVATSESWTPNDRSRDRDLYLLDGDRRVLLTVGNQTGPEGAFHGPFPERRLADGSFLISTGARLNRDDPDAARDIYRIRPGSPSATRLLTGGNLRITDGPPRVVSPGPVTFRFAQSGTKLRFHCAIDRRRPRICRSPVTYRGLKPRSRHVFRVFSTGPAGTGPDGTQTRRVTIRPAGAPPDQLDLAGVSNDGSSVLVGRSIYRWEESNLADIFRVGLNGTRNIGGASARATLPVHFDTVSGRTALRTNVALAAADDDLGDDVYSWSGGGYTLLPDGVNLGSGPTMFRFSDNGRTYAFATWERLVPEDQDNALDVYRGGPGGIRLISLGTDPELNARPLVISGDGSTVLFATFEQMLPADSDGGQSLYLGDGDTVRYVSPGGLIGEENEMRMDPDPVAIAGDGSRVILETASSLVPEDGDELDDVYEWSPGGLRLLSQAAAPGGGFPATVPPTHARWTGILTDGPPWGNTTRAVSPDGGTVFITTRDRLLAADADSSADVYRSRNGNLDLVGPPAVSRQVSFAGANPDGNTVLVTTTAALARDDRNGTTDLYRIRKERVVRVTAGNSGVARPEQPHVIRVSRSGDEIAFLTGRSLVTGDRDGGRADLYLWKRGRTTLLSRFRGRLARVPMPWPVAAGNGSAYYFLLRGHSVTRYDVSAGIYRIGRDGKVRRIPSPPPYVPG